MPVVTSIIRSSYRGDLLPNYCTNVSVSSIISATLINLISTLVPFILTFFQHSMNYKIGMEGCHMKFNNSASNRVLAAFFDKNWIRQRVSDGHVVYVATSNKSTATFIVQGTRNQKVTIKKGQRIFVVGGTFHFPPHDRVFV